MARFVLRANGQRHEIEGDAGDSLLSVLRYELGLTGSKSGCGEGHCGARARRTNARRRRRPRGRSTPKAHMKCMKDMKVMKKILGLRNF
jgi:hypothetical protein